MAMVQDENDDCASGFVEQVTLEEVEIKMDVGMHFEWGPLESANEADNGGNSSSSGSGSALAQAEQREAAVNVIHDHPRKRKREQSDQADSESELSPMFPTIRHWSGDGFWSST